MSKGKQHIFGFFLLACMLFMSACGPFHISRKRYSDGFYVDYSKSETPKKNSKIEKKEKAVVSEDSTKSDQFEADSTVDTVVVNVKDSSVIQIFALRDSSKVDSISTSDSLDKSNEQMVVVKGEDYFQLLDDDVSLEMENFILFILCIVAPPVAVYIKFGGKGKKIRTVIFLTILGWIPGVFYAFFQISGDD